MFLVQFGILISMQMSLLQYCNKWSKLCFGAKASTFYKYLKITLASQFLSVFLILFIQIFGVQHLLYLRVVISTISFLCIIFLTAHGSILLKIVVGVYPSIKLSLLWSILILTLILVFFMQILHESISLSLFARYLLSRVLLTSFLFNVFIARHLITLAFIFFVVCAMCILYLMSAVY
jgi:hypothetical protein